MSEMISLVQIVDHWYFQYRFGFFCEKKGSNILQTVAKDKGWLGGTLIFRFHLPNIKKWKEHDYFYSGEDK